MRSAVPAAALISAGRRRAALRRAPRSLRDPYWIAGSSWHRGPELIARTGEKSMPTRKRPGVWTSSIV